MIDVKEIISTFSFLPQEWFWILLMICGGAFVANFLILLHTQNNQTASFVVKMIYSKSFLLAFLFCIFDFVFVMIMYGSTPFALLVACVLFGFFVMSYIDCILLAVPDWLNFLCFFGIFVGLYYLNLLGSENFISAFCVAGGLSILKIFGSFVFRKEILGEADIVVFTSMGALLPLYLSLHLIFLACFLAAVYILLLSFVFLKNKEIAISKIKIPFVVFLTIAFVIILAYARYGGSFV